MIDEIPGLEGDPHDDTASSLTSNLELYQAHTFGFLMGLAEKVTIGACRAAMASPLKREEAWVRDQVKVIAQEYALNWHEIPRARRTEFWFVRELSDLVRLGKNEDNNLVRGLLCGYPLDDIDEAHVIEAPSCGVAGCKVGVEHGHKAIGG